MVIDPGILKLVGELLDGLGKPGDGGSALGALSDEEVSGDSSNAAEEIEDALHESMASFDRCDLSLDAGLRERVIATGN